MTPDAGASRRVLEPIERVAEVLFGLIMVLTFTGALSVAEAGRADVREMLIGALGCNLAWGLIDAVFYLMGVLADKGRRLATLRTVRGAAGGSVLVTRMGGGFRPGIARPTNLPVLRSKREASSFSQVDCGLSIDLGAAERIR